VLILVSAEVSALRATSEGVKTTLNLLANACDGAKFPLKAVPQTVLLVIQHIEVRIDLYYAFSNIHTTYLFKEIQALAPSANAVVREAVMVCGAVARHYQQKSFDAQLRTDVDQFLG
jgi:hypothetical protein